MLHPTLARLRAHPGSLVAAALAIVLAVAFVAGTLAVADTAERSLYDAVAAEAEAADVVVVPPPSAYPGDFPSLDAAALEAARGAEGVAAAEGTRETSVELQVPGAAPVPYAGAESLAQAEALRWQELVTGRLPAAPGEVALDDRTARREGVAAGDTLAVREAGDGPPAEVTVVGTVDFGASPEYASRPTLLAPPDDVAAWSGSPGYDALLVLGEPGVEPAALRDAVSQALDGSGASARTGREQARLEADAVVGDLRVLTAGLLALAAIAVFVAALVIANTFAVLVAQRTRDLALLRCVGATRAQVRGSVLGEAFALGVVASALGVLAGFGLAAGVSAVVSARDIAFPLSGLAVGPLPVVAGMVAGVVVTLAAALLPARRATRVAPLAALRPVDAPPVRSRAGVLRLAAALLLAAGGTALLVLGAVVASLPAGIAGGMLSFLGVLLGASLIVPPAVRALGALLVPAGGAPARLAAANAVRNPGRTAASAAALLVGVTVITLMVTGAASARRTMARALDGEYPVDVVVTVDGGNLDPAVAEDLAGVDGVTASALLRGGTVAGPAGDVAVQGVDPAAARAVLPPVLAEAVPVPGSVLVPDGLAQALSVDPEQDAVPLRLGNGEREVVLAAHGTAMAGTALTLAEPDLARLLPDAPGRELWLAVDDDLDADEVAGVVADVEERAAAVPGAFVAGGAVLRTSVEGVVETLLLLVTGLLGVAVLIALVGIGNTLALSVVERRRESALLRALGLTRGQLRAMLAIEAMLVAAVAALLGVVLGVAYGWAGAAAALGSVGAVVLALPAGQIAMLVAAATLAGLLASVLPARRAARTPPVEALAD